MKTLNLLKNTTAKILCSGGGLSLIFATVAHLGATELSLSAVPGMIMIGGAAVGGYALAKMIAKYCIRDAPLERIKLDNGQTTIGIREPELNIDGSRKFQDFMNACDELGIKMVQSQSNPDLHSIRDAKSLKKMQKIIPEMFKSDAPKHARKLLF